MAAAQAQRTVEEIHAHTQMAEEDRAMLQEKTRRQGVHATCPQCNVPLPGQVKFCPSCGARIQAQAHCAKCSAKLLPGAKFCPECGAKVK